MIFDDSSNSDMRGKARTKDTENDSFGSNKFETSLEQNWKEKKNVPQFYELFRLELNENWANSSLQKPISKGQKNDSIKSKTDSDESGYWLNVRRESQSSLGVSIKLSQPPSERQMAMNLNKLNPDSFTTSSNSSKIHKSSSSIAELIINHLSNDDSKKNTSLKQVRTKKKSISIKRHVRKVRSIGEDFSEQLKTDKQKTIRKKNMTMTNIGSFCEPRKTSEKVLAPLNLSSLISLDQPNDLGKMNKPNEQFDICLLCKSYFILHQEVARTITCGHMFHKNCLIERIEGVESPECPFCHSPL